MSRHAISPDAAIAADMPYDAAMLRYQLRRCCLLKRDTYAARLCFRYYAARSAIFGVRWRR